MSGYKLNRPIIAGVETKWYRLLKALYQSGPMSKKEWLNEASILFTDERIQYVAYGRTYMGFSHRHWRGLYPDLFSKLRQARLVEYNRKQNLWHPNYATMRMWFPGLWKLKSFEQESSS